MQNAQRRRHPETRPVAPHPPAEAQAQGMTMMKMTQLKLRSSPFMTDGARTAEAAAPAGSLNVSVSVSVCPLRLYLLANKA